MQESIQMYGVYIDLRAKWQAPSYVVLIVNYITMI